MAVIETAPTAVHIGDDELPFVDIGDGNQLKVIQVKEREGLWIVENIFQAGYAVQTPPSHRPGLGLHDLRRVEVQGVRLRQPGGIVPVRARRVRCTRSVHRGRHPGVVPHVRREPEPRRRRQRRERHRRRGHARRSTSRCARRRACPARTCSSTDGSTSTTPTPTSTPRRTRCSPSCAARIPSTARTCRTSPATGRCSKHADVAHVAREPKLFSASEGGVMLENLDEAGLVGMRNMLLAMDPPRHVDVPAPARAALQGAVIGAMDGQIRAICREIMAAPRPSRSVEFVHDVAAAPPLAGHRSADGAAARRLAAHPGWRRGTRAARTPRSPTATTPSTATRTSTWRCTRSSSPGAAGQEPPARTSPR